ncbi:MAG: amidase family protein [Aminobacteriaceae bacterium]
MSLQGFEELSATELSRALRDGTISCRELTERCLLRIAEFDRTGPALKAIISVNPSAIKEAEALDRRFRGKMIAGPLHGIPVLLKDNVETRGLVTTSGSLSMADYVPDNDAFIVQKLRNAGAIVLAKANMHEFAVWGESVSSVLGQALNPYDLTRTPGGSSGGTGAGIAASFAAAGIGTDTVNSIRSPASACSCVGIRPTLGLVSRRGIVPYSLDQDTAGPICRTVEDAALVLDAIAGYDPLDPETAWCAGHIPPSYRNFIGREELKGKKLGILKSFFGDGPEHGEVNAVMEKCLCIMRDCGAELIEVKDPLDPDRLVSEVSVHLHTFKNDLEEYLNGLGGKVPYHALEELIHSGKIHPGILENLKSAAGLGRGSPEYAARSVARLRLRTMIMKIFADLSLDALVFPHQRKLVVPAGETQTERNGVLGAVTGFPAIVVPGGFSRPTGTAPGGIPIGLELLGPPWSEGDLISIAHSFEQLTQFRRPPFSTPPLS